MNKVTKLALFVFAVTVSGFAEDVNITPVTDSQETNVAVNGCDSDAVAAIDFSNGDSVVEFSSDSFPVIVEELASKGAFASDFQVVSLYDMMEGELDQMMEGLYPEMVIEFPAQAQVPLQFFLKGDLVNFVGNQDSLGVIEIAQTFYLRSIQGDLFLSTDLTQWVSLFDFITGEFCISFHAEEGSSFLAFGIDLNRS